MSMGMTEVVIATPPAEGARDGSSLEWAPILGGAVLSAAITAVMAAFGSALGLSLVSAEPARSSSAIALSLAAGLWAIWITVSACASGGYLAGRMRRPAQGAGAHERHVRDGAHGLVVWAVGTLVATVLASSALVGAADRTARAAASAAGGAASLISQNADPLASALDAAMRSTGGTPVTAEERNEASRIFMSALGSGRLEPGERDYLASRLATRAGIAQPEAQKRIDEAYAGLERAKETAKQAAEKARRAAIITAFLTAAVLLLGAVAALLAAQLGGRHRDEQIDLSREFGTRH